MAVMGLRLAGRSNAVSKLHGAVSREMFGDLWPDVPSDEVPIGSITNGVHASTWVSAEVDDVLSRHVLPEWGEAGPERWSRIHAARDDEIWRARDVGRERLVAFVRRRLRESFRSRGFSPSDLAWCDEVLDPSALTVCFARRFATYKRATLLLSQPDRLKALLLDTERPVQFVFAGKAHPADDSGKAMIQKIVHFAADLGDPPPVRVPRGLRHRRRPRAVPRGRRVAQHAAPAAGGVRHVGDEGGAQRRARTARSSTVGGTSCFDGENGWAITSAEVIDDDEKRDETEAHGLFELFERQIVPLFYERRGATPRGWIEKVKHDFAIARAVGHRQPRRCATTSSSCTSRRRRTTPASAPTRTAIRRGSWRRGRPGCSMPGTASMSTTSSSDPGPSDVGEERTVEAIVALGDLDPRRRRGAARAGSGRSRRRARRPRRRSHGGGRRRARWSPPVPRPPSSASRPGGSASPCGSCRRTPLLATPVELGRIAWA